MNLPFRIEKKESFRVIGYMIQTTNKKGEGRKAVPPHIGPGLRQKAWKSHCWN